MPDSTDRARSAEVLAQVRERKRRAGSRLAVEAILAHRDADRRVAASPDPDAWEAMGLLTWVERRGRR